MSLAQYWRGRRRRELLWESPVAHGSVDVANVLCAPVDATDPVGELVEAAVGELGESPGLTACSEACDVVWGAPGTCWWMSRSRRGVSRRCVGELCRVRRQRAEDELTFRLARAMARKVQRGRSTRARQRRSRV